MSTVLLQERIDRVINNHQCNCQHPGNYLFVLKGFGDVLKHFSVPVKHLEPERLYRRENYYITFEESQTLSEEIISTLRKYKYRVWIVDFNLFPEGHLAMDGSFKEYPQPDWFEARKTISIFNTINPLIGIVEDPKANVDRMALYRSLIV